MVSRFVAILLIALQCMVAVLWTTLAHAAPAPAPSERQCIVKPASEGTAARQPTVIQALAPSDSSHDDAPDTNADDGSDHLMHGRQFQLPLFDEGGRSLGSFLLEPYSGPSYPLLSHSPVARAVWHESGDARAPGKTRRQATHCLWLI